MNYVFIALFGLLLWFAIEVDQLEEKQQADCENRGGVLMTDRNSDYVCVKKEAIVK